MRDWRQQSLMVLIAAALVFTTLPGPNRLVSGNPAESASLLEEVKKDVETDEIDELNAVASNGIAIGPVVAAYDSNRCGCGVPPAAPSCFWRTRGPPVLL